MLRRLIANVLLLGALGAPFGVVSGQTGEEALVHLKAGAGYLQLGKVEQAVRECKAAVALDPQSAAAHMLLGQAYLAQRSVSMIAEAKAELQQALDLNPDLIWARFYLAKVYIDLGRNDKAKEELELGLKARPNVPHFLSLLGEVNRKLGNPGAALELNRKALEADPALTPAYYFLALAYMDLKKEDDAVRELENSIRSKYVAPEMYLTLGSLYMKRRRYAEAEDLCRKAIALDVSRAESYLNLGQLYNVMGASEKALTALRQALEGKSFPTSPYYQQLQADVFFETGRAYRAKHMGREAVQAYSRSLEFDANRGVTHRALAELSFEQGDVPRARAHAAAAEKFGSPVDPALRERILRGKAESAPLFP